MRPLEGTPMFERMFIRQEFLYFSPEKTGWWNGTSNQSLDFLLGWVHPVQPGNGKLTWNLKITCLKKGNHLPNLHFWVPWEWLPSHLHPTWSNDWIPSPKQVAKHWGPVVRRTSPHVAQLADIRVGWNHWYILSKANVPLCQMLSTGRISSAVWWLYWFVLVVCI